MFIFELKWFVFPASSDPYEATMRVVEPSAPVGASFVNPGPLLQQSCELDVRISMYCMLDNPVFQKCNVFYGYSTGICKGKVDFCSASVM